MSGELGAAGDLANAGLIAGAIEGPSRGPAGEGACLNCGAALNGGRFCSNCGQPAHANRSLWALVEELAWNVFNLDTKAWRTVPRLIGRPGTLTRSYIDGKRARYLTPLATFLLCYFFMFLVFSAVPKPDTLNLSDRNGAAEHVSDSRDDLKDAQDNLQEAQQGLAELRQEGGAHPNTAQQLAFGVAERAVAEAQRRVQRRQAELTRAQQQQQAATLSPVQVHVNTEDEAALRESRSASAPVVPPVPGAQGPGTTAVPTPPPHPPGVDLTDDNGPVTLDDVLRKIARENVTVDGRGWLSPAARAQLANPPLFYSHLQDSASRWGFLLVPLSLPFIAFLFLFKKNITLYDHTVFALNSLSFASLLFAGIIASIEVSWLHWIPGVALGIVLPVHTFFHIGGAYKMKWWSALWRTFFMLFFATFVLIIFMIAVLFIGLAG
jgi:F0F1-type ATP synthase membrane subunit b/b'